MAPDPRHTLPRLLQLAVFALLIRPLLSVFLGLGIRHRERLPRRGPAILIANHNSHLDTLAVLSGMPLSVLWQVRPVAAADHFGKGIRGWMARHLVRALLIERGAGKGAAAVAPVLAALDRGEIILFFPEGSRGEPEVLAPFRPGIAHLVSARPAAPVIPVYLHNTGKCCPKGTWLPVPFTCEMIVGQASDLQDLPPAALPGVLRQEIETLSRESLLGRWDRQEGHGLG